MSIGYANICSSEHTIDKKIISIISKYWFWNNKREQWN